MQWLKKFLQASLLDEQRCVLCHIPYQLDSTNQHTLLGRFCPDCRSQLQAWKGRSCLLCGKPFDYNEESHICDECLCDPPLWKHLRFYGPYQGMLRILLLRGKFRFDIGVLHLLGQLLADRCVDLPMPDAILPMPLHVSRLRERGFNQSLELARGISNKLGVPIKPHLLERSRATPHQVGLNRAKRLINLKEAFTPHDLKGKKVLLVDDTMTTSATLRYATECILEGGAIAVDVAVVARTIIKGRGLKEP